MNDYRRLFLETPNVSHKKAYTEMKENVAFLLLVDSDGIPLWRYN